MEDALHALGDAWTLYNAFFLVVGVILFFAGLFGWGYVIAEGGASCRKLLIVEIIVQLLVLVGSVFRIGMFDYEEKILFHIRATLAVDTLVSVIGFYIAGIHIMAVSGAQQAESFYIIIDFFVQLLIAVVLGFLPSIIIAVLMWVLVRIFGKPL